MAIFGLSFRFQGYLVFGFKVLLTAEGYLQKFSKKKIREEKALLATRY